MRPVYRERSAASIDVAYWNSFGWRCAQYTMSCFLYYYFRELKNRTKKEKNPNEHLLQLSYFSILLSFFFLLLLLFYYCLLLSTMQQREYSDDCGCRRGRQLLVRSSPNDIRCRRKRQGNVKNRRKRRNLTIGNYTKKLMIQLWETHVHAHD